MIESLLSLLACPICRSELVVLPTDQNVLHCETCRTNYLNNEGIWCLLPQGVDSKNIEEIAKDRERKARDEQSGDYDRMIGLKLFGIAELPLTLRMMKREPADTLVEVGCGTGRMTTTFANRTQRMIALDFSFESLKRCQSKLRANGIENVLLVQGDATALPLKSEISDQVVSCQVLEHLPNESARRKMVEELSRIATFGATVVLSAYKHSLLMKLFGKKEGEHEGGIYYYRFSKDEIRNLMERTLTVKSMTGALVYHYLVAAEKG
jgi:ubiquinone/menaquinone biosynthesis C-methylase UbiE